MAGERACELEQTLQPIGVKRAGPERLLNVEKSAPVSAGPAQRGFTNTGRVQKGTGADAEKQDAEKQGVAATGSTA